MLLAALSAAGIATVPEPGRRVVVDALGGDRKGLPWDDPEGFAKRALALALEDWNRARAQPGPVVFDRGLIDAVAAYQHATGRLPPDAETLARRYNPTVLLAPPWPALFAPDSERRHAFTDAEAECARLLAFLPRFGYRPLVLPRAPLAARLALLRAQLN